MQNTRSLAIYASENSSLNLLCFHTVDDSVHHREDDQIHIHNESGYKGWGLRTKGRLNKGVEKMATAVAGESLLPFLGGCHAEN